MKVLNPLVDKKSLRRKFHKLCCDIFGCIHVGSYYGMVQSHCRRCGKKTLWAVSSAKEFIHPWGKYE